MLTHKARERAAFRYIGALERGDFDAIAALLRSAERDPALARMLAEIDQAYSAELDRPPTDLLLRKEIEMTALTTRMGHALPKRTALSGLLMFAAIIALTFVALLTLRGLNSAPQPVNLSGAPLPELPSAAPLNDSGTVGSLCYQVTDSVPILRAGAGGSDMLTPEMVFRIQTAQRINERTWLYVMVGEIGAPEGWIEADGATFRITLCDGGDLLSAPILIDVMPTVIPPTATPFPTTTPTTTPTSTASPTLTTTPTATPIP